MMTDIEEQLASGDPGLIKEIASQLEEKYNDCRRRLSRGATPEQYKQWQQEIEAVQAAQFIFNRLKGE